MFTCVWHGQRLNIIFSIIGQATATLHYLAHHLNIVPCSFGGNTLVLDVDRAAEESVRAVLGGLHDTADITPAGDAVAGAAAGHTGDYTAPELLAYDKYGQPRPATEIFACATTPSWSLGLLLHEGLCGMSVATARQNHRTDMCAAVVAAGATAAFALAARCACCLESEHNLIATRHLMGSDE